VTANGLSLHGDPANRLEDTVAALQDELKEVNDMAAVCKDEGDIRGYKDLKKLAVDIRKEIAKFMGIEPPKKIDMNTTSAEATRQRMEQLFPTEEGDDMESEEENN